MTGSIGDYNFYFEKEAESLLHSLGQPGENILFVETEVITAAGSPLQLNFPRAVGDERLKSELLSKIQQDIKSEYDRIPTLNSFQRYISHGNEGHYPYISFREKGRAAEILGETNSQLMRLFKLYHETGHALIPCDPLSAEFAADAYAALRLLQRFGDEARPFLSMLSWARAVGSVFNGADHLTTTVLDKIIADSALHKNFSGLSPDATITLAKTYARDWKPAGTIIIEAENTLVQARDGKIFKPDLLAATCLSSPVNDFTFYIATRIIKPYLDMDEVVCNGDAACLTGKQKDDYRAVIADRMLAGIFNQNAARETLPLISPPAVILPRGQTRLVYKNRIS